MTSSTTSSYGSSGRDRFAVPVLLLQQQRFPMAEQALREILANDSRDVEAHWLLTSALNGQKRHKEALESARESIALAPDLAPGYYLSAVTLHSLRKYKESEKAAKQAHDLDPGNADYCGLLAALEVRHSRWEQALEWAEMGLQSQADHSICNNMRAHVLQMLGRNEEAQDSLDVALHRRPEDSDTHANQGWQHLRSGDYRQATEHFKQALRIEPGHEYARAGMIEALKARNPLYRPIFAYFVWMSRLSQQVQWMLVIGLLLVFRFGREALAANPATQWLVVPFIGLYLMFVLTSWTGVTIFNMTLWFHPLGRHVLNRDEKTASLLCAAAFALGLACLVAGLSGMPAGLFWAAVFPFIALPISATFRVETPWKRQLGYGLIALASGIALWGAGSDLLAGGQELSALWSPLVLGLVLFTWVGNLVFRDT